MNFSKHWTPIRSSHRTWMDEVKAEETNELLLDSVDKQRVHSPLVLFNFDMNDKRESQKGTHMLARVRNATTPPVSLLLPRIGRFIVRLTDNDSHQVINRGYLSVCSNNIHWQLWRSRLSDKTSPEVKFQGRTSLHPCTPSTTKLHVHMASFYIYKDQRCRCNHLVIIAPGASVASWLPLQIHWAFQRRSIENEAAARGSSSSRHPPRRPGLRRRDVGGGGAAAAGGE